MIGPPQKSTPKRISPLTKDGIVWLDRCLGRPKRLNLTFSASPWNIPDWQAIFGWHAGRFDKGLHHSTSWKGHKLVWYGQLTPWLYSWWVTPCFRSVKCRKFRGNLVPSYQYWLTAPKVLNCHSSRCRFHLEVECLAWWRTGGLAIFKVPL